MTALEKFHRGRITAFSLLILLTGYIAVESLLKPLPWGASLVLGAVGILPLTFFLRPLWRGDARSALWLGLLLLPYLCWAALGAFAPGTDGLLAMTRAALISACFIMLMLMVRWHKAADLNG
ncbi:MAG TPA: DUF2069 domain-containing protein [Moraxellaceae bacterium]|nr:DUF2069 domain-containing protein [Moraxellaceae bacterium]